MKVAVMAQDIPEPKLERHVLVSAKSPELGPASVIPVIAKAVLPVFVSVETSWLLLAVTKTWLKSRAFGTICTVPVVNVIAALPVLVPSDWDVAVSVMVDMVGTVVGAV